MKFIKSNLAKKLIIILVALMIFNIAIPKRVDAAWNFSGILMKPISSLVLSFLVSIDVTLGATLNLIDVGINGLGPIVEQITELADEKNLTTGEKIKGFTSRTLGDLFIGPDTIFAGDLELLNANIFEATTSLTGVIKEEVNVDLGNGNIADTTEGAINGTADDAGEGVENAVTTIAYGGNFAGTLKKGIATTYVVLRNICAMIMLAGLIFTGIRVLVTANTPTKTAQWKQLIQDWLIGMILLIFSHVLMYGIFWVSDKLTESLRNGLMGFGGLNFNLVKTCLMSFDSATQVVCLVLLAYLIYLTIIFAIAYFKRLLWVCVLIVIAPIVSIMYAFGNQTKQIYSKWIREYVTTVLVQPFHLIVYYTLVSIPLNMVSAGSLEFTGLSTFQMIYALGAISFIRPAEKYIRELFGMSQGITNMASFDSGKQTFDAIGNAVKEVANKVILAAGAVASGGATLPMVAEEVAATEVLNPWIGETNPDNLLADIPGSEIYPSSRDPFHEDYFAGDPFFDNDLQNPPTPTEPDRSEGALNEFLDTTFGEEDPDNMEDRAYMETEMRTSGFGDKFNEEQLHSHLDKMNLEEGSDERAEYERRFRESGHGDIFNEEQLQNHLNEMNLEEGSDERAEYERRLREAGHGDPIEESVDNQPAGESGTEGTSQTPTEQADTGTNNMNANNVTITAGNVSMQGNVEGDIQDNISQNTAEQADIEANNTPIDSNETHDQSNISANNVIITAGNVSMQGNIEGDIQDNTTGNINTVDDESADDDGDSDSDEKPDNKSKEEKEQEERKRNDAKTEIEYEGTPVSDGKEHFLARRLKDLNAARDFAWGEHGISGALGKLSPDSKLGAQAKEFMESDAGKKLKRFEDIGGLKDLHAGFNNVRDTFFVNGAPGDWKTTNARMDEGIKANIDQIKFNICNNPEFKNFFIQKKYEELKNEYKDNPNYSHDRLMAMAKREAKTEMKSLADTYVPLGVTDAKIMFELDEDRKKYGYKPEEAVKQRIRFEKFNINVKNVEYTNKHLKTSNSTVVESIPNARDYYNSGYTDIGRLNRAYQLTEVLSLTHEHGMKLDRALSNKGSKINLNLDKRDDLSDKQKKRIMDIVDSYKKEDKE